MKWMVIASAAFFFASISIAGGKIFKAADQSAERVKGLIAFFVGFAIIGSLADILISNVESAARTAVGVGGFMAASVIFWFGLRTIRSSRFSVAFAAQSATQILTHGPYRWVRHPFYACYMLGWASAAIYTQSLLSLCLFAFIVALYTVASEREERFLLASPFGAQYAEYRARTKRFIPGVL